MKKVKSEILRILKENEDGLTQSEITSVLGISRQTLSRHLKNLVKDGFVKKIEKTYPYKYHLSQKAIIHSNPLLNVKFAPLMTFRFHCFKYCEVELKNHFSNKEYSYMLEKTHEVLNNFNDIRLIIDHTFTVVSLRFLG